MVLTSEDRVDNAAQALLAGSDMWLSQGSYELPKANSKEGFLQCSWRVQVTVYADHVTRSVFRDGEPWSPGYERGHDGDEPVEVIWPAWPASPQDEEAIEESPLKDLQQRWDDAINRLRDSAKWMATVLGAALASVVPTAAASFTTLAQHGPNGTAILFGLTGLACLSITLLLILAVLRPQSVSFTDIELAQKPGREGSRLRRIYESLKKREVFAHRHLFFEGAAFRWQHKIESNSDLYLPCGVYTLVALRQLMTVEEATLKALSDARKGDRATKDNLDDAQRARAARLHEFHAAAGKIVAMGNYYQVRSLSTRATLWAALLGVLGIVSIITAIVHWPMN